MFINVEDFKESEINNLIKKIGSIDKILNFDMKKIAAAASITIGITKEQFGIEIGDNLLVYGKAIYDIEQNLIKFITPKYLIKNK